MVTRCFRQRYSRCSLLRDLDAAISKPETRIWRHLLLVSLVASIVAVAVYARALSHVVNLGNQIGLSNLHLVGIWFGAVGVSLSLLLFSRHKEMASQFYLALLAILDAALTLRLSQDFMSNGRQVRALLGRVDAGHKTRTDAKQSSARVGDSQPFRWRQPKPQCPAQNCNVLQSLHYEKSLSYLVCPAPRFTEYGIGCRQNLV